VTQDPSCLRGFLWNVQHDIPADIVIKRLQDAGWASTSLKGILWTFQDGFNKVDFVPSSLRLQVRIDMLAAYEDRRPVADRVWATINDVEPPVE
jgi:hypothetical protein